MKSRFILLTSFFIIAVISSQFLGQSAIAAQDEGTLYWRGDVDDVVHLVIRKNIVETRVLSGSPQAQAAYSFTHSFPSDREVTLTVNKKEGRGNVKVFQQPNSDNGFEGIVEIADTKGGAREYQLEIVWK